MRRAALKQDFYAVRDVLRTVWNPVGVSDLPEDEYDSYAWRVVRLLKEGALKASLVHHLREVERLYFGWDTPEARLRPVARALLALDIVRTGEKAP